jgi:polyisoprenoid-binding protein YceI
MLRRAAIFVLGALIAGPVAAQSVSKDPSQAPSGAYRIETSHSQILFAIPHIGLTNFYGRFDRLSGTLNFDSSQPEKSAVSISVDATSVDTPSGELNNELKALSVFNTASYPTVTFKSTAVMRTGPDTGKITGELSIRGVTKPVTLDAVFGGGEQNPMGDSYVLGFHATATVKRSDYGMTGMMWSAMVGDEVQLTIEAMFEQEKK